MPKLKVKSQIATLPTTPSSSCQRTPIIKRQKSVSAKVNVDHDCLTAIKKNSIATKRELPFLNQEINWNDFDVGAVPEEYDPEDDMFAVDPVSFDAL